MPARASVPASGGSRGARPPGSSSRFFPGVGCLSGGSRGARPPGSSSRLFAGRGTLSRRRTASVRDRASRACPGEAGRGCRGEPGTRALGGASRGGSGLPPAFLIFWFLTTLGGRRSGVVVPDLGPLLFEGVRSGTLETERSRPPAPGHARFSRNSRGHSARMSGRYFVLLLSGRCPAGARAPDRATGAGRSPRPCSTANDRVGTGKDRVGTEITAWWLAHTEACGKVAVVTGNQAAKISYAPPSEHGLPGYPYVMVPNTRPPTGCRPRRGSCVPGIGGSWATKSRAPRARSPAR